MESVLRKLKRWSIVKYPHLEHLSLDEDWNEDWLRDDTWAANIMPMHISPATLARYDLPRPISSHELLRRLKKGPKPFRFLDLPREIRDEIIREAIVEKRSSVASHCRLHGYEDIEFPPQQIELLEIDAGGDFSDYVPGLLEVSRQVREEASAIFWKENHFSMRFDTRDANGIDPLKEMCAWAKNRSADHLNSIREFSLRVDWGRKLQSTLHLKYRPEHGMKLKLYQPSIKTAGMYENISERKRGRTRTVR